MSNFYIKKPSVKMSFSFSADHKEVPSKKTETSTKKTKFYPDNKESELKTKKDYKKKEPSKASLSSIRKDFKSGFVSVIGRPNAGKSTLLNHLLGQKVLIMSDKPQTTRNRIQCVLTEERGQIVFLDTPGIHKPKHKLGEYMVSTAKESIREVDVILYVVDAAADYGSGEEHIVEMLKQTKTPCILALNKVDLIKREQLIQVIKQFSELKDFLAIVPISAKTGENTEELLKVVFSNLEEGPMYYPEDEVTDQPERFVMAELIREKVLHLTREEIPHSIAVIVEKVEQKKSLVKVNAMIIVERDSQKGIIIGKGGNVLKEVGRLARQDIENLLGSQVFLELWVKVKKDWRNRIESLREFGYEPEHK